MRRVIITRMPEILPSSARKAFKEINLEKAKITEPFSSVSPMEVSKIIEKNDLVKIGSGAECVVVSPKKNIQKRTWKSLWMKPEVVREAREDIVIAFDYFEAKSIANVEEAKRRFYTQRILSTLFPHNFPHFYSYTGARTSAEISSSVREKKIRDTHSSRKIEYPFEKVQGVLSELGWDFMHFDTESVNFILAKDGGEYYVDTPKIYKEHVWQDQWQIDKLLGYMGNHNYSDIEKRIVLNSINRIQQLYDSKKVALSEQYNMV